MPGRADATATRIEDPSAYLAALVDSSDDAILSRTPDGIVTSWNPAAEKLFGYGAGEIVGRHVSLIVPEDRLEELKGLEERIMRGEQVKNHDTVRLSKDRTAIPVSLTLSPIFDPAGVFIGISSIARDNTERMRFERLLRESEARYRVLVEMAPDAVFVHQDGRYLYANCAALGLFGFTDRLQLQRHSLYDLVHPDDVETVRRSVLDLREGDEAAPVEYRVLRSGGEEVAVEASSALIEFRGTPAVQTIARNVTERKNAELERDAMFKELTYQRSRFETVVKQLPIGILITEAPSGKVVYQNDRSFQIFRQEIVGAEGVEQYRRWRLCRMNSLPLPVEEYPLARALKGESVRDEEFMVERGDGTLGYVCGSAIPIRDASGTITTCLAAFNDVTEQKTAVRALSDSEERLKLALEAAGMGSCDMQVQSGEGIWSEQHFLLLGYPAPEGDGGRATTSMWLDLIHPEDRDAVLRELERAKERRAFFRSEHRIVRADSSAPVWVNVMGRFLCDASGGACRFIGVIFDVSERKAAEEALRRSEKRFRMMADAMPQIVWTAEPDGSVEYLNAYFELYTGVDRGANLELVKSSENTMAALLHPDDVERSVKAWRSAVATGEHYQVETRIRRRDGEYRWHLARGNAERDDEGRILKWYGFSTDIHELKETQEKLRASEATLMLAIETTDLGIFELDLATGKGEWSAIAKKHYGFPVEAVMDLGTVIAAVHPEDRERIEKIACDAARPDGPGWFSAEYRTIGVTDGKERWLSLRAKVSRNEEGKPARLVGACLNVTEAVQAQNTLKEEMTERLRAVEELRRQEQLLIRQGRFAAMGEMIANIAHQWRQPLNTLALIVQEMPTIYQRNLFSLEYLEESVSRAMQVINYMSQTIDGFRNFFGPDKEKQTFHAAQVLEKTVAILDAAFTELKLRLDVVVDPDVTIFGSSNEFSQVILNLLMNAKDALVERKVAEPRVEVRLLRENDRTVLTVTDNAGGIGPDIMEKIFDPYFTTKGPDKGTGIGLFMSKMIIEKNMGGTLSVRNTENGAEFRIEV